MATLTQKIENGYFVVDRNYMITYANLTGEEPPKLKSRRMIGKPRSDNTEKIQRQWPQIERLSAMREMIASLVHKVNNPLASALGYAQLLLPKMEETDQGDEIKKVIKGIEQASYVVKNLATFIKNRQPQKDVVNLNDLIEGVVRTRVGELNRKSVKIIQELSPSPIFAMLDPTQIQYVLLQMIKNAEEAISESHGLGTIRLKTRIVQAQIEITISDDGPGISEENIPKVFNSFFTTKENGMGLGLTISYGVVTAHGGTLRVESKWGTGTTLFITLPMVEKQGKRVEDGMEKDLKGLRGIVIDDERAMLNLLSEYLQNEGYRIETAQDVKTALGMVEERDFDFAVCDMRMPEMGGADFYHQIKAKKPSLRSKIIFITGDIVRDKTLKFIDSTGNPCMEKPFNLWELKRVVSETLKRKDHQGEFLIGANRIEQP